MSKTHYLGRSTAGAYIGRASGSDYGYTHAAVIGDYAAGSIVDLNDAKFSRSADGARKSAASQTSFSRAPYEVVPVHVVDGATYRRVMKQGGEWTPPA